MGGRGQGRPGGAGDRGGAGSELGVYKADGRGGFERLGGSAWSQAAPDDVAGLAAWAPAPGQSALLAAISMYETDPGSAPTVWRIQAGTAPQPALETPQEAFSPGPLAVADVDGDGQLDLFVGGRVVAGRYPAPASSLLCRNQGGKLVPDEPNSALFKEVGLVNGAVWSDLDGDGWPDLVLACEWGPIRIFRNDHGKLTPWDWKLTFVASSQTLDPKSQTLDPKSQTLDPKSQTQEPGTRNAELPTFASPPSAS